MCDFVLPKTKQWKAAEYEAREIMIGHAQLGKPIPYSDLVAGITAIRLEPHDPRVGYLVGQISRKEDAAGRGMLSVLVVHKNGDQMPGQGFFDLAAELGRDTSDREKCWIKELNYVLKVWAKK